MAENVRPPVAIRIVRPYESEEALLEHELETIGKTSVLLIGAHPRPTGVILRFEVTLGTGATVLRGEGRVLAHKENAFRGQPGLTLRFTRLDPQSKAVVDRATAMREARSQTERGTPSRPAPAPAPRADSAVADALTASTPAPAAAAPAAVDAALAAAREKANATARENAKRTGRNVGLTPPPVPADERAGDAHDDDERATPAPTPVTSVPGEVADVAEAGGSPRGRIADVDPDDDARTVAPPPAAPTISAPPLGRTSRSAGAPPSKRARVAADDDQAPRAPASTSPIEPPPDRAELLARLRERAATLPAERVEAILAARPR